MAEVIYDKSKTSSQSTVKLDTGETVRAENVVVAAGGTGGTGALPRIFPCWLPFAFVYWGR